MAKAPAKRSRVKKHSAPQLRYFARAGNVAKMGPFTSYEDASAAVLGADGLPVERAFIWAEVGK